MGRPTGVSAAQRRTLDRLSHLPLRGFYLADGTAIAAHLGHRRSLDIDLFSASARTSLEAPRRAIVEGFEGTAVVEASDAAIRLLCDGAPLDLVRYPYPLLQRPVRGPGDFPTARLLDLAVMKLSAIARRGIRRDFWDLYEITTRGGITLRAATRGYVRRYGVAEADLYAVLRSLTYFGDAEAELTWPAGLRPRAWARIREYFVAAAPALLRLR
jgi:hypothetical protein